MDVWFFTHVFVDVQHVGLRLGRSKLILTKMPYPVSAIPTRAKGKNCLCFNMCRYGEVWKRVEATGSMLKLLETCGSH